MYRLNYVAKNNLQPDHIGLVILIKLEPESGGKHRVSVRKLTSVCDGSLCYLSHLLTDLERCGAIDLDLGDGEWISDRESILVSVNVTFEEMFSLAEDNE